MPAVYFKEALFKPVRRDANVSKEKSDFLYKTRLAEIALIFPFVKLKVFQGLWHQCCQCRVVLIFSIIKTKRMKTLMMTLVLAVSLTLLGTTSAEAQTKKTTTAQQLMQNLQTTTTQNGLINVGGISVAVSNVTVQDLVTVQSVLNNADIRVLNDALNNNEVLKNISVDLYNLLRNANVLNKNQVIVGVLSDQDRIRFVTQNANAMR